MKILLAVCCAGLVSLTDAFGYTNYHLPQKTTQRIRWLANRPVNHPGTGVNRDVMGCQDDRSCESMDQVQPNFKTRAMDRFEPLQATVLIQYDELDFHDQDFEGTVVATGAVNDDNKKKLLPGTKVYFNRSCTAKWTAALWTTFYGADKAASMHGKLIKGVDLNNANGWGFNTQHIREINEVPSGASPIRDTYMTEGAYHYGYPTLRTFQNIGGNKVTYFDDYLWGSGRVGQSYWESRTLNVDRHREDTPEENPNQQANYLLCDEAEILGIINEVNFNDITNTHYLKASSVFEQSKYPFTYAQTNRILHTSSVSNTHFYRTERTPYTGTEYSFQFP